MTPTSPTPQDKGGEGAVAMPFRPLRQTIMHNPPESYGDCQRTCLAMLLGIDPQDVPHFADENVFPIDKSRDAEKAWLASRDLGYVQIPVFGEWGLDYIKGLVYGTPVIISGRSPRGDWNHDVVLLDGEIHDPHPDNTGLAGPCIDKDNPDEPEWYWVRFVVPSVNSNPAEEIEYLKGQNKRLLQDLEQSELLYRKQKACLSEALEKSKQSYRCYTCKQVFEGDRAATHFGNWLDGDRPKCERDERLRVTPSSCAVRNYWSFNGDKTLLDRIFGWASAHRSPFAHSEADSAWAEELQQILIAESFTPDLTSETARLRERVRVLEEALRPFADLGVGSGSDYEVDSQPYRILRGAIRLARSALHPTPEVGE